MTEDQATDFVDALGGQLWRDEQTEEWMVLLRRGDGKLVLVSDDMMCEFDKDEAPTGHSVSTASSSHP